MIQTRKLIESFHNTVGVVQYQLESFEECINRLIPDYLQEMVIKRKSETGDKTVITVTHHTFSKPTVLESNRKYSKITPMDCRLRNLDYTSKLRVNLLEQRFHDGAVTEEIIHRDIVLADIPVMTRSSLCYWNSTNTAQLRECPMDPGGYFIVNGNERVLIAHEKMKGNQVYTFRGKKSVGAISEVRSSTSTTRPVLFKIEAGKSYKMSAKFQSLQTPVPVGLLLRACNIRDDEIRTLINAPTNHHTEAYLDTIIRENKFAGSQREALVKISAVIPSSVGKDNKYNQLCEIMSMEFIPHLGHSAKKKGVFTCLMISKILRVISDPEMDDDDRDHFVNKRVEISGHLIAELFRSLLTKYKKSVKKCLDKGNDLATELPKIKVISKGLKYSMGTGNWGMMKNSLTVRTGVSQIMSRLTWSATISHLRRLITPTGKNGKVTKVRSLHQSHWGYICPSETPEGAQCGIVKNFAITFHASLGSSKPLLIDFVRTSTRDVLQMVDEVKDYRDIKGKVTLFVNDDIIGFIHEGDVQDVLRKIKNGKHTRVIHKDVSVSYNHVAKEIKLYCDSGRCMRPLLVVREGKLLITNDDIDKGWKHCVEKGVIAYIDHNEEEWELVTTIRELKSRTDATYCEIDPYLINGNMAATIPLPDYNQAPRNAYQTTMGKQALGFYATNHPFRFDTFSHVLSYPQRQLMPTEYSEISGHADMASGFNAIVAIMCFGGNGQEDAIIMNRGAIQRGMGATASYKCLSVNEQKYGSSSIEKIEVPPANIRNRSRNYGLLDEYGIVKKNVRVREGDIVVGRVLYNKKDTKDCSVCIKKGEEGIVDSIFTGVNRDGYRLVKIKVRQFRFPEVGDKFASMAAQKGTVGMIYAQADMPFNSEGISPDIIVNPAYLPSRMTVSQPVSSIAGKITCMSGKRYNSTPFRDLDIERLNEEMKSLGLSSMGEETMYSGITGKMFRAKIFVGPIQFQRLKHMVKDKIHSRSRGPYTSLCRQPVSGRSRAGGLRVGNMEKDCIISHGCASFLQDRMFYNSDKFTVDVCRDCGVIITGDNASCNICNDNNVAKTNLPYACKLLFQELSSVGVKLKLETGLI